MRQQPRMHVERLGRSAATKRAQSQNCALAQPPTATCTPPTHVCGRLHHHALALRWRGMLRSPRSSDSCRLGSVGGARLPGRRRRKAGRRRLAASCRLRLILLSILLAAAIACLRLVPSCCRLGGGFAELGRRWGYGLSGGRSPELGLLRFGSALLARLHCGSRCWLPASGRSGQRSSDRSMRRRLARVIGQPAP